MRYNQDASLACNVRVILYYIYKKKKKYREKITLSNCISHVREPYQINFTLLGYIVHCWRSFYQALPLRESRRIHSRCMATSPFPYLRDYHEFSQPITIFSIRECILEENEIEMVGIAVLRRFLLFSIYFPKMARARYNQLFGVINAITK